VYVSQPATPADIGATPNYAVGLSTQQNAIGVFAFFPTSALVNGGSMQYASRFYQSAFQRNVLNPTDTVSTVPQPNSPNTLDAGDARTQQVTQVGGRVVSGRAQPSTQCHEPHSACGPHAYCTL
jgi:hypothetical protein